MAIALTSSHLRAARLPLALGLIHGVADCISGFLIGSLPGISGPLEIGGAVLLYNVLAFGGQLPAGLLVDRLQHPRLAVQLSVLSIALAVLLFPAAPMAAIILAGVGSAVFHVGAGMASLLALPGAAAPGLFAAPGVMGLALGGYFAYAGWAAGPWLLLALGLTVSLAFLLPWPVRKALPQEEGHAQLELHDVLMMVLLLAIAMRSAVWNVFQAIHHGDHELLLAIGLAAMSGKFLGGFAADALGWRRYPVIALSAAALLLGLGGERPAFLVGGVALLQSATPAAVSAMWRYMPAMPATASGICFGLAIAAGGIPLYLGLSPGLQWALIGLPLAAGGYFLAIRWRKPTSISSTQPSSFS